MDLYPDVPHRRGNFIDQNDNFLYSSSSGIKMNYKPLDFLSKSQNLIGLTNLFGKLTSFLIFRLVENTLFSFANKINIPTMSKSTYESGRIALDKKDPFNYIYYSVSVLNQDEAQNQGSPMNLNERIQKKIMELFLNRGNLIDIFIKAQMLFPFLHFYSSFSVKHSKFENNLKSAFLFSFGKAVIGSYIDLEKNKESGVKLSATPFADILFKRLGYNLKLPFVFNLSSNITFEKFCFQLDIDSDGFLVNLINKMSKRNIDNLKEYTVFSISVDPFHLNEFNFRFFQIFAFKLFKYVHLFDIKYNYKGLIRVIPSEFIELKCFFNFNLKALFSQGRNYATWKTGFSLDIYPIGFLI